MFTPESIAEEKLVEDFFAPKLEGKVYWLGYVMLELSVKDSDKAINGFPSFWGSVYTGAEMPKELQEKVLVWAPTSDLKEHCLYGMLSKGKIGDLNCLSPSWKESAVICSLDMN